MDTRHRVKNFWRYFMGVEQEIRAAFLAVDEDMLSQLKQEVALQAQSVGDIAIELELQDDFFELSFHGGANKTKQYICSLLKKEAPKALIDHWIINAFRQPLSQTALHAQIQIEDQIYHGSDFIVYYEIDRQAKCIHVSLYCEALLTLKEEQRLQIACAMLELYIGEIELEARIGDIQVITEKKAHAQNFCLLANFYEDICDIVMDEEWSEYREPCAIYSAYKLDQALEHDALRKDMILIITTNPQLQEELFNHEQDTLDEAMRFGAQYGYLYYEITQQKEQIAFVRQQLERELHELFYPMSVARTIGGAIGTHYAYIDVLIYDFEAFEILLEKLNEHLSFPLYYQSFHA